jgi:hypothetical protein
MTKKEKNYYTRAEVLNPPVQPPCPPLVTTFGHGLRRLSFRGAKKRDKATFVVTSDNRASLPF